MEDKELLKNLNELVMLLSVYVKRGVSQATLINELSEAGFQPKRIAELIGTSSNTVSVALNKAKRKKKSKKD
jgi:hypothetical protein